MGIGKPVVYIGIALACLGTQLNTGAAPLVAAPFGDQKTGDGEQDRQGWERAEVPEPPTLSHNGRIYQAIHWGRARGLAQNGGYIAVIEQASGKELALVQIYALLYNPEIEADIQDIFIHKLTLAGTDILIENELGERFALNMRNLAVTPALGASGRKR